MPLSRFLLKVDFEVETVVDVGSALLVTVRLVRLASDDKDETFAFVRGRLSIEDCDEAINYKRTAYDGRTAKYCLIYFSAALGDSDANCLQSFSTLERPSISLKPYQNTLSAAQSLRFAVVALQ